MAVPTFTPNIDPKLLARVPKRFQPFYTQAMGEAYLRYSPQQQGLLSMLADTHGQYHQDVAQANAAADLLMNAARTQQQQVPQSSPVYGMLAQHAVDAAGAAKYQITAAQQKRDAAVAKIQDQLTGLGNQAATYFTSRADDLVNSDRKLRHDTNLTNKRLSTQIANAQLQAQTTQRGQDLTHQTAIRGQNLSHQDRQASIAQRQQAAANKKAAGPKLATPQQHGALQDTVTSALNVIKQQQKFGQSRSQIAQTLLSGRPAQTVQGTKVPALPKVAALPLSIALDLAFDGHVSRNNINRLHSRRFSVKKLGYPTLTQGGAAAVNAVQKVNL